MTPDSEETNRTRKLYLWLCIAFCFCAINHSLAFSLSRLPFSPRISNVLLVGLVVLMNFRIKGYTCPEFPIISRYWSAWLTVVLLLGSFPDAGVLLQLLDLELSSAQISELGYYRANAMYTTILSFAALTALDGYRNPQRAVELRAYTHLPLRLTLSRKDQWRLRAVGNFES